MPPPPLVPKARLTEHGPGQRHGGGLVAAISAHHLVFDLQHGTLDGATALGLWHAAKAELTCGEECVDRGGIKIFYGVVWRVYSREGQTDRQTRPGRETETMAQLGGAGETQWQRPQLGPKGLASLVARGPWWAPGSLGGSQTVPA